MKQFQPFRRESPGDQVVFEEEDARHGSLVPDGRAEDRSRIAGGNVRIAEKALVRSGIEKYRAFPVFHT